jgi:hypothetical protein
MNEAAKPENRRNIKRNVLYTLGAVALGTWMAAGAVGGVLLLKNGEKRVAAIDERANAPINVPSVERDYKIQLLERLGKKQVVVKKVHSEIPSGKAKFTVSATELKKPRPQLPPKAQTVVQRQVDLVNGLLKPENMIVGYAVEPIASDSTNTLDGYENSPVPGLKDNRRAFELQPRADTPIPAAEAAILSFHEGMHIFSESQAGFANQRTQGYLNNDLSQRQRLLTDVLAETGNSFDSQTEYERTHTPGEPTNKQKNKYHPLYPLIALVDESSYYGNVGHPYDDYGEFFADTATTMHFFPKSYMASVNSLENRKDRAAMKDLTRDIFAIFDRGSVNKAAVDRVLSPELRKFSQSG